MKRIFAATAAVLLCLVSLTGCMFDLRPDKEQITDVVEDFFEEFNEGDYEEMLSLMSERQQNIIDRSMGLMGSLIGFDISDMLPLMFDLGMGSFSASGNEMLSFEITNIEIEGEDAKVYGNMTIAVDGGAEMSYAVIKVVKEGFPAQWKIDYINPDTGELDLPMNF